MSPTRNTASMTLKEAFDHACRTRWAHTRGRTLESQARIASDDVARIICRDAGIKPEGRTLSVELVKVAAVTEHDVNRATAQWYAGGLAPATINKRLNCLSVMGVKVQGCKVKEPNALKWWLSPQEEARAVEYLEPLKGAGMLSLYIQWATRTGLRVEESLRLTRGDFQGLNATECSVTIPGLKTATSQATLPLTSRAADIATSIFHEASSLPSARMWPFDGFIPVHINGDYEALLYQWDSLKAAMGWPKEATLKALRRSAARYLHVDCGMPLDMVRQYLRHEDIKTTMGYLRLTGGYGTEEMRRYLK